MDHLKLDGLSDLEAGGEELGRGARGVVGGVRRDRGQKIAALERLELNAPRPQEIGSRSQGGKRTAALRT
jgi:hypothetical protein